MQLNRADNELGGECLLNFAVNSLNEELSVDIRENVEVAAEMLYEVRLSDTKVTNQSEVVPALVGPLSLESNIGLSSPYLLCLYRRNHT